MIIKEIIEYLGTKVPNLEEFVFEVCIRGQSSSFVFEDLKKINDFHASYNMFKDEMLIIFFLQSEDYLDFLEAKTEGEIMIVKNIVDKYRSKMDDETEIEIGDERYVLERCDVYNIEKYNSLKLLDFDFFIDENTLCLQLTNEDIEKYFKKEVI